MLPETLTGWVQLILNAGAIVTGGVIWKQYFTTLKATVGSKQAEIDLLREKSEFWHERATELDKQSPAAIERVLAERIDIREKEIVRLSSDRDQSSKELARIRQEVVALNRAMDQMKGFRQVLAMETPEPNDPNYEEYMEYLQSRTDQVVDIEVFYMGSVGVDSGQLMITDPSYIDSEWVHESYTDDRVYKDESNGTIVRWGQDFTRFDEPLPDYEQSPEELIKSGRWVQFPPHTKPEAFHYSYDGACQATSSEGFGELAYRMGHTGAAVVFGCGWGDGMYDVYGEKQNGRVVRVYINTGAEPAPLPIEASATK